MEEGVFYFLTTDDIQTVAEDQLDRRLTDQEIEMVKDLIAERIEWFGPIADVLNNVFGIQEVDKDENSDEFEFE